MPYRKSKTMLEVLVQESSINESLWTPRKVLSKRLQSPTPRQSGSYWLLEGDVSDETAGGEVEVSLTTLDVINELRDKESGMLSSAQHQSSNRWRVNKNAIHSFPSPNLIRLGRVNPLSYLGLGLAHLWEPAAMTRKVCHSHFTTYGSATWLTARSPLTHRRGRSVP